MMTRGWFGLALALGSGVFGCATSRPAAYGYVAADVRAWEHASTVLDFDGQANFGGGELTSGFVPDPWAFQMTAGGGRNPINIASLSMRDSQTGVVCGRSFVTRRPDFHFNFNSSAVFPLLRFWVFTSNGTDTTLVIREPDGHWRCNDDHGRGWQYPTMPAIDFRSPQAGRYDIWVGSFDASANNPASLYVTEVDGHHL